MSQKTFPLISGTLIEVPKDLRLHNYQPAKDPHRRGHQPMVVRLVYVEAGQQGNLYGFQMRPSARKEPDPAKVMFVPHLAGGETLVIEWVDPNCLCAQLVTPAPTTVALAG